MPRRRFALAFALTLLPLILAADLARAEPVTEAAPAAINVPAPPDPAASAPAVETAAPETPIALALRQKIAALAPASDEERNEYAAISAFYEARGFEPLWATRIGLTPKAAAVVAEIQKADDWGLDTRDFKLPQIGPAPEDLPELDPAAVADGELTLALAIQKYARFARGGRIIHPGGQLNSNIDRRPQFIDPKVLMSEIAAVADVAAYLHELHPAHSQFERLRQKYLAARAGDKSIDAKKVLANMEQWRWMWRDLGGLHMIANVPEFMLNLYKNGEIIFTERIVAGELDKQTAIFSRRLKHIVLRPQWRVPESIKVYELQPSLRRGGGMFYKYGLQLETKDGQPLDFKSIDWTKADIRDYEVTQPTGRKSVLGHVKFSFPSQHTIYMHDTPDKYMFNAKQRTLSHGCLRLRNPMKLVEVLLAEDKGWDRAKIDELSKSGPINNEVAIEGKIPIHITYFTAWVDDGGTLKTFKDVYGHELRIKQALEGKWDKIAKGRDHLAPPDPNRLAAPSKVARARQKKNGDAFGDFLGAFFGSGF